MNPDPAMSGAHQTEPEATVRPTIAPPTVAFGALLLMWGIQLGWLVAIAGAVVLTLGLARWLREVKLQWMSRE